MNNSFIFLAPVVLLAACQSSTVTEGLMAEIRATPRAQAASIAPSSLTQTQSDSRTKGFRTAEGQYMELQRGLLNLLPVALERCANAAAIFERLSPLAFAHAHGGHDGAPPAGVVDVNRPDGSEIDLGALAPAPGSYCGLRLQLQPVRSAAAAEGIDMRGASVYLAPCSYDTPPQIPALPVVPVDPGFLIEGGCLQAVKLPATREFSIPVSPAMSLSDDRRSGSMMIAIAYDRWFDGVDLATLETDPAQQARVLDNIAASMSASPF